VTERQPRGEGWEAHRREQLVQGLAATPAQRVAWLEEVLALAYRTGALPAEPTGPPEVTPEVDR
jgi:hypothetical protein